MHCATVIVLIILVSVNGDTFDCNGKEFLCYDDTKFYHCVQFSNGTSKHYGEFMHCPVGLYCNDEMDFECEELSIINELTKNTTPNLVFDISKLNLNNLSNSIENDFDYFYSSNNNSMTSTPKYEDFVNNTLEEWDQIKSIGEFKENELDQSTTNHLSEENISNLEQYELDSNKNIESIDQFKTTESIQVTTYFNKNNTGLSWQDTSTLISTFTIKFQCKKTGIIADPHTCSIYHICIKFFGMFLHTTLKCPNEKWFDSKLKRCTKTAICNSQYNCNFLPQQPKPLPNDCGKYYVCKKKTLSVYDVDIHQCPSEHFFDMITLRCVKIEQAVCLKK